MRKEKVKRAKDEEVNGQRRKKGYPDPTRGAYVFQFILLYRICFVFRIVVVSYVPM